MAIVHIPRALRSFSGEREQVEVEGRNLRQVFDNLDVACPGIKERLLSEGDIHPGIAVAVDDEFTNEGLLQEVPAGANIFIVPAMGGGAET